MKNRLKKISTIFLSIGLVLVLTGITYSFFVFSLSTNSTVVKAGEVYVRLNQDNELDLLENIFPETYNEALYDSNGNLREDNIIEFSVIGKNRYKSDVYYEIDLDYGDSVSGKTRINDKHLFFELTDITDSENPIKLISKASYSSIEGKRIYVDTIEGNQELSDTEKEKNYRLRVWIDYDHIKISDTTEGADYKATDEHNNVNSSLTKFSDVYASVKVCVKADFIEKSLPFTYMINQTVDEANLFTSANTDYYAYYGSPTTYGNMYLYGNGNKGYSQNGTRGTQHTKYSHNDFLFPSDYFLYDSDGAPSVNTNGFYNYAPYVETITMTNLSSTEMNNYIYNTNGLVRYVCNLTDTTKNNSSDVYMFVVENGNVIDSHEAYEIIIASESIIMFPVNSKGMFTYYEKEYDFMLQYEKVLCYYDAIDELIDSLDQTYLENNTDTTKNCSTMSELLKAYAYEYFMDYDVSKVTNYHTNAYNFFTGNSTNIGMALTSADRTALKNLASSKFSTKYPNGYYDDGSSNSGFTAVLYTDYYEFENLKNINLSNICTKNMEIMDAMFMDLDDLEELDLGLFDTSSVTSMDATFCGVDLEYLDLSSFNTDNLEVIKWLFGYSNITHLIGITNWDVSRVTDVTGLFSHFTTDELDLSGWHLSSDINFRLFTITLNSEYLYKESEYETIEREAFSYLDVSTLNISGWTVNQRLISSCSIENLIARNCTFNFANASFPCIYVNDDSLKTIDFTNSTFDLPDFGKVIECYNYSNVVSVNIDNIVAYDELPYLIGIFYEKLVNIETADFSNMTSLNCFFAFSTAEEIDLNEFNFDSSKITYFSYVFYHCSNLTSIDLSPLGSLSNITNMYYAFDGCSSLVTLDLSLFNTYNVTNMGYAFADCASLTYIYATPYNSTTQTGWTNINLRGAYAAFKNSTSLVNYSAIANLGSLTDSNMGDYLVVDDPSGTRGLLTDISLA